MTITRVAMLTAGGYAPCLSSAVGGLIERYTELMPQVELIGYKAISYADGIEREAVYGARRHKIGMTKGKVTTEQGSMTMYLKQHRELLDTLGDGWTLFVISTCLSDGVVASTALSVALTWSASTDACSALSTSATVAIRSSAAPPLLGCRPGRTRRGRAVSR